MTVCTSYCVAVALGATLNYVLPALILIQLAFLHGILESSGQTKPFAPPCQSSIDSDDIGRTGRMYVTRRAKQTVEQRVCCVPTRPERLVRLKDIMCVLEGLASLFKR